MPEYPDGAGPYGGAFGGTPYIPPVPTLPELAGTPNTPREPDVKTVQKSGQTIAGGKIPMIYFYIPSDERWALRRLTVTTDVGTAPVPRSPLVVSWRSDPVFDSKGQAGVFAGNYTWDARNDLTRTLYSDGDEWEPFRPPLSPSGVNALVCRLTTTPEPNGLSFFNFTMSARLEYDVYELGS